MKSVGEQEHEELMEKERRLVAPLRAKRLELEREAEMSRIKKETGLLMNLLGEIKKIDAEIEAMHRATGLKAKREHWHKIID